jgi:pimeloyl-ACP methyl ester carboxylesterase
LAQDVSVVIDEIERLNGASGEFAGRLDVARIGLYGVSMGSIVGGEALLHEPRVQAAVLIDAPMTANVTERGFGIPLLWITRHADTMAQEGWGEWDITTTLGSIERANANSPKGQIMYMDGMFHPNFTDGPHWMRAFSLPALGMLGPTRGAS